MRMRKATTKKDTEVEVDLGGTAKRTVLEDENSGTVQVETRLPRTLFAEPADVLSRKLLGCVLVRVMDDGTRLAGRIVETEAYLGAKDRGSHAFGGRRGVKNEAMY